MRIGIDARFYGTYGKGLGRYTQKLIENLEKVDDQNEYVIFLRKENWEDYQPINSRFTKVLADYRWYTIVEQFFMPIVIWRHRVDIMHFTHFNVPFLYFGKFVVTIHDLILIKYPTARATTLGPLFYRIKHAAYMLIIRSAIWRAKKIIAVSEYTKKEILKYFRTSPEKILVTYEAVDDPIKVAEDKNIIRKYSIKSPYLLYVGNAYPHKNIDGLLAAFKRIIKIKPNLNLVLVGKDDYFFRRLKQTVRRQEMNREVIFTGFVTDSDLPSLYHHAELYIFPSFCEGFGLPALEACSYGLPVVASDNSSLPEILDKAAVYFDPHQEDDIYDKVVSVLDDKSLQDRLIKNGYDRVRFFSWIKMAELTLKLYKS
ncbi:glycosyltransferase family 4 protein [Patescibacteria group bacterium]|nr:glycosyltransferase family 4 protein [Patescibacteria group bacterium]